MFSPIHYLRFNAQRPFVRLKLTHAQPIDIVHEYFIFERRVPHGKCRAIGRPSQTLQILGVKFEMLEQLPRGTLEYTRIVFALAPLRQQHILAIARKLKTPIRQAHILRMLHVRDTLVGERPYGDAQVKVGRGQDVTRVGRPVDFEQTGRALVYLTFPLGILQREHLDNVPLVQTAQDKVRVGRPLFLKLEFRII